MFDIFSATTRVADELLNKRLRPGDILTHMYAHVRGRHPIVHEQGQVEPYVIAADVYGVEPHVGRGGWTWYTGSAGWMFRVALESVLGVTLSDATGTIHSEGHGPAKCQCC